MDIFSTEFFTALLAIVLIDLILAGDNAIVIGMAARNLPKKDQKPVIIWGTVGAIVVRALATLVVVWLLKVPGLLLIGGLFLIWIAYKLMTEEKSHDQIKASKNRWEAIQTIIIADAIMGLDNVLAVAGTAHGNFLLVVFGLLISIPIMVWGSTLVIAWIERFPMIIYIGAGVIALTAGKMIVDEPLLESVFMGEPFLQYGLKIMVIASVLLVGYRKNKKVNLI